MAVSPPLDGSLIDIGWAEEVTNAVNQISPAISGNASYSTAGVLAGSTGAEVAVASWTANASFTFKAGRIYAVRAQCLVYNNAGAYSTVERMNIRLRRAVNSTSAQLLGVALFPTYGTGSLGATSAEFTRFVKNATGADLGGEQIGMTVQRETGSNTNTAYGDGTYPAIVTVIDVGLIADATELAAISAALT